MEKSLALAVVLPHPLPYAEALVHGMVSELSPMKCSNKDTTVKYFTGKLTNE